MHTGGSEDRPAIFFDSAEEFRQWLQAHHDTARELWVGFYRKDDPRRGLTWEDAVPEALCFGWIDSVSQRIDDASRRQRWTPRKPNSIWSEINIVHVERLRAEGLMTPAGLAAFERRRADRTGVYSHERRARLGEAQESAIAAVPAALAFWRAATPSYRRAVAGWVQSAKREETRQRRLQELVTDSAAGRLVKPQRYGDEPAWLRAARTAARKAQESATPGAVPSDSDRTTISERTDDEGQIDR